MRLVKARENVRVNEMDPRGTLSLGSAVSTDRSEEVCARRLEWLEKRFRGDE